MKYRVTNTGPALTFHPTDGSGPLAVPHTPTREAVVLNLPDEVVTALRNTGGLVQLQAVRVQP